MPESYIRIYVVTSTNGILKDSILKVCHAQCMSLSLFSAKRRKEMYIMSKIESLIQKVEDLKQQKETENKTAHDAAVKAEEELESLQASLAVAIDEGNAEEAGRLSGVVAGQKSVLDVLKRKEKEVSEKCYMSRGEYEALRADFRKELMQKEDNLLQMLKKSAPAIQTAMQDYFATMDKVFDSVREARMDLVEDAVFNARSFDSRYFIAATESKVYEPQYLPVRALTTIFECVEKYK